MMNGKQREPQPLGRQFNQPAYPVDALPPVLRDAVLEVQGFTQAPTALIASSAITALSVAAQALADVRRDDALGGPISLYLLTVADSGERKTTCDKHFMAPVREYERRCREQAAPAISTHRAAMAGWKAKQEGLVDAIKRAAKKSNSTKDLEGALAKLQNEAPPAPRIPQLLRGDDTPEALLAAFVNQWRSLGIASSEAGLIFGAHGMNADSIMRNLSTLNVLWDGGVLTVGRKTSESFTVHGVRFTCGLMVQRATVDNFIERSSGLVRGSGFLARFLIAWPESTQGQRLYKAPPAKQPALAQFHARIHEILALPIATHSDGALDPFVLRLDRAAQAAWIAFHDRVELAMRSGGALHDVRDVASKAADNAARMAGLFHVLAHGPSGTIGESEFKTASDIVTWHLNEARRFFGELALPPELARAYKLDAWLRAHCEREGVSQVSTRRVLQYGPGEVRGRQLLDEALEPLIEADRVWLVDRRNTIEINPALLSKSDR